MIHAGFMKFNGIIDRYIIRELIPPFFVNVAFFTFVFLMTRLLDITKLVVNYQVGLWDVARMLFYSMPFFFEFVIPMSVMIAVLLTFLRLSNDNEIVALKGGGMSLYRLAAPVMIFALAGCLLTAFMAIYAHPWGRLAFRNLLVQAAGSSLDAGLKQRTFMDDFSGVMLYVNRIDLKERLLIDVFIEDRRNPDTVATVIAPRGQFMADAETHTFHLRLFDGSINRTDIKARSVDIVDFDSYDMRLELERMLPGTGGDKHRKEMTLSELRQFIETRQKKDDRYYLALMEFHKKFSLPFACFPLGLLAIPLGIHSRMRRKFWGIGLGLFFFLLYYMMLSAGLVFGEAGIYPPAVGMWAPDVVMGGIGLFLLVRSARERYFEMDGMIGRIKRLKERWLRCR